MNIFLKSALSRITGPEWLGYSRAHLRKIAAEHARSRCSMVVAEMIREQKARPLTNDGVMLHIYDQPSNEPWEQRYGPSPISLADWDCKSSLHLMNMALAELAK